MRRPTKETALAGMTKTGNARQSATATAMTKTVGSSVMCASTETKVGSPAVRKMRARITERMAGSARLSATARVMMKTAGISAICASMETKAGGLAVMRNGSARVSVSVIPMTRIAGNSATSATKMLMAPKQ